ncbi:hypothetical protein IMSAGC009_03233 [Lachnospiraceae bacterium]|nr:hypothetical protein IMSAGC009_03233 [Lachnospiraceae bacterium]
MRCFPSSIGIKGNEACNLRFLLITCFQDNISGNSIFLPCFSNRAISVIPTGKFITFLGAGRKHNGIANLCGNIPAFHLPSVCVKGNGGFRPFLRLPSLLFPAGEKYGIFRYSKFRLYSGAALLRCVPAKKNMPFLFCFRQLNCLSLFHFHGWNLFSSVRIKRDRACGRFFPNIMGFQGDIISDCIIFPCLPHTGVPVIPSYKFITFFGTRRKHNGIANLCGNVPSFHFPSVCVKGNRGFRPFLRLFGLFLPAGVKGGIFGHGNLRVHSGAALFCRVPAKENMPFPFCFRQPGRLSLFHLHG